MASRGKERLSEPLVVCTHVTPWGFLLALPLASTFAALAAWTFGSALEPGHLAILPLPLSWLVGSLLLAFALLLFCIGIAESANYLKPSVEVVFDDLGVSTYGVLGARRVRWDDLVRVNVDQAQLALEARGAGPAREVRLHFNRLAAEPADLVARVVQHRPDLGPNVDRDLDPNHRAVQLIA